MTGVLVTDTTGGWHIITNTPVTSVANQLTVPASAFTVGATTYTINAGDAVTVTIAGVVNPPSGTYTDFTVQTFADTVPANAPSYTITAAGTAGVNVIVNPATTGARDLHDHRAVRRQQHRRGRHCQRHHVDGSGRDSFPDRAEFLCDHRLDDAVGLGDSGVHADDRQHERRGQQPGDLCAAQRLVIW